MSWRDEWHEIPMSAILLRGNPSRGSIILTVLLLLKGVLPLLFRNFPSGSYEYPPLNTFFPSDETAIGNKLSLKPGNLISDYYLSVTLMLPLPLLTCLTGNSHGSGADSTCCPHLPAIVPPITCPLYWACLYSRSEQVHQWPRQWKGWGTAGHKGRGTATIWVPGWQRCSGWTLGHWVALAFFRSSSPTH